MMQERGMSVRVLARIMRCSTATVDRIANGRTNMNLATMEKLAKALGTTPCAIVCEDQDASTFAALRMDRIREEMERLTKEMEKQMREVGELSGNV